MQKSALLLENAEVCECVSDLTGIFSLFENLKECSKVSGIWCQDSSAFSMSEPTSVGPGFG